MGIITYVDVINKYLLCIQVGVIKQDNISHHIFLCISIIFNGLGLGSLNEYLLTSFSTPDMKVQWYKRIFFVMNIL
jgi:hypothetical protein